MSSHANRSERNLTEERQIKAEENWNKAKGELKAYAGGCLFVAILLALALCYLAGYVSAWRPACDKPTHVSTP